MQNIDNIYQFVHSECERLSVDKQAYGIGKQPSQGLGEYRFEYRDGKWTVFIYERGKEYDFAWFESDYDAIRYFFLNLCTSHENRVLPQIQFKNLPS